MAGGLAGAGTGALAGAVTGPGEVIAVPGGALLGSIGFGAGSGVLGAATCKSASSPIGRRGNPMNVKRGTNSPEVINGRKYTGHALDQMQGRGIPSSVARSLREMIQEP